MISFGLFSDTHYAKDKVNKNRYCSLAIEKLNIIIKTFNAENVDFAVCLGDAIDTADSQTDDINNLMQIYDALGEINAPLHFVMGNHDIETMDKNKYREILEIDRGISYYSFMHKSIKFIVLDANFRQDGIEYSSGNYEWTDSYIPDIQRKWLADELSCDDCDNTFIFIHQNLDHRLYDDIIDPHIVKNADEIRELLEKSNKKITVFQGHYHHGYKQNINGIDYITLSAVCEGSQIDDVPFMIVEVDDDGAVNINRYPV